MMDRSKRKLCNYSLPMKLWIVSKCFYSHKKGKQTLDDILAYVTCQLPFECIKITALIISISLSVRELNKLPKELNYLKLWIRLTLPKKQFPPYWKRPLQEKGWTNCSQGLNQGHRPEHPQRKVFAPQKEYITWTWVILFHQDRRGEGNMSNRFAGDVGE